MGLRDSLFGTSQSDSIGRIVYPDGYRADTGPELAKPFEGRKKVDLRGAALNCMRIGFRIGFLAGIKYAQGFTTPEDKIYADQHAANQTFDSLVEQEIR